MFDVNVVTKPVANPRSQPKTGTYTYNAGNINTIITVQPVTVRDQIQNNTLPAPFTGVTVDGSNSI